MHGVKSFRIRSYSGPYYPAFELNVEIYFVSLRIQSECGRKRTRITPHKQTFYAVMNMRFISGFCFECYPILLLYKSSISFS